jgi:hypothetical protein
MLVLYVYRRYLQDRHSVVAMMVRGEPEYIDQVPRRLAYEQAHPNVEIIYLGPYWQAIIHEDNDGKTIITRHALKGLLDKLEALDRER